MLKKAAYSLGILGTLVVLALRVFDAEPILAFCLGSLTILGLACTLGHATVQLGIAGFLINAGEIAGTVRYCTSAVARTSHPST